MGLISERTERITKWLAIIAGLGFVVLFAFSATLRLLYPYEVEWMEGSMIDHAIRVLHHQPIYAAPSVDFVAWLYPPGYYYAVAAMMHLTGEGFFAGRLVSVIATLVTAALLGSVVHRITKDKLLSFFGAILYIATYHVTGYYFDIARNDSFFVLLVVLAAFAASRGGARSAVTAIALLTLGFYSKQQEVFFGCAIILWFWMRSRREGMLILSLALVAVIIGYFVSNALTDGWFSYYVLKVPGAKRADLSMLHALRVVPDYLVGSFAVTTVAILAFVTLCARELNFWKSERGLLVLLWVASILAGAMSLGNEGGYKNVMMPFAAFSAAMLPIALHELRPSVKVAGFVWVGLLLQFLALSFDPTGEKMLFAGNRQRAGAQALNEKIGALPGDVYIPYHGYISRQAGKPSHAHVLATMDVMRMNDTTAHRLARDFDSAYATRFNAVILEESKAFDRATVRGYHEAGTLVDQPNVGITRVADEATRPNILWLRDTNSR